MRNTTPFYLRRNAQPVGWRVCRGTHTLRDLNRRNCLNRATKSRSEFCGEHRRLPAWVWLRQTQRDAGNRVVFLLVPFLWRSKEKELASAAISRFCPQRLRSIKLVTAFSIKAAESAS